jgi:acyl transferase domain-containing protein
MSVATGMELVTERARLMQSTPKADGCMVASRATEAQVMGARRELGQSGEAVYGLGEGCVDRGHQRSERLVLSGSRAGVKQLLSRLGSVLGRRLLASQAFHSPPMAPGRLH